ncbi:unnamed protein product [Caenorhabditis brenneri]
MTDFLKSNPIALRHCLLYEYLQKKPVEESFQEFRKTVGDIIKRKEFGFWFIRFGNGMFSETPNNQKPQYNMMEVLLSDPKALRACILYEFLKPNRSKLNFRILAGYNHFCEVIGEDVMEYAEFDFWFYRFLNGEFDLDFKGERYQRNLLDMPIDIMKNVVEYSDIFDRMALARTSRSLRTFVGDQKLFHHTLKLKVSKETAIVSFGESNDVQYISEYFPTCGRKLSKRLRRVRDLSAWKKALLDLISILKYPKLHLDNLEIEFPTDDSHYEYLESPATLINVLEDALEFTHYLNVKKLILKESNLLINLLPTIKPRYLTTINIRSHQKSMEKVFEMEQWKQAKYFKTDGAYFVWPLRHLYHLKEFTVRLRQLSLEDVRQMKEILFKSPDFKKCSLFVVFEVDIYIFAQEFGNALRENPMTDFFKNNPIALRHCIRFEILQGNSIEQAYSNICIALGEEVIDYKRFKIRFNHFSKKKFNDKEGENPCAKILCSDKYALRVCIFYECLKYQRDKLSIPIFEVFVNFCKVIGVEDVLQYPEFEFWFYQFLNGEHDSNYEREMDKKIYELMDMPIDVMEEVVKYLDFIDRIKLAKTSRSLQTFVEDQKLFHHILKLRVADDQTTISFDESDNIEYIWENVDRQESLHHWEQALLVLKSILKNPKLHLYILEIELDVDNRNVFNGLEDTLKFTHHLNVEHLILEEFSMDLLMKVLPTLKPGHLTTITMLTDNPNPDSMDTVFEMEQWKQAKCFSITENFIWPLRHLYHFVGFRVCLIEFSVEDIRQMKETLFKSPNFEHCLIIVDDANAIEEEFDFLKSNPIALRHCLLYEFLHGKRFLKSFYDFCETVGNDLITRKEFDTWFRRFANGRFYKKNNKKQRPISNMAEILRNDPKALRTCILYEFISTNKKEQTIEEIFMRLYLNLSPGFLIFTKYKNFCKVIGDDVMEYPEFEFWFYRFSNGEFDLDFKMEKNQKTLLDMPIVVMEKIVENLDIFDRLFLSKTCHSLRIFTRSQKLFHHTLSLHIYHDRSRISFGCLVGDSLQYTGTTRKFKNNEDNFKWTHWEQAIQDFNGIIHSYPKLQLGVLQITSQRRLNGARFKGPTQIHVNCLILETGTQSIDIFPRILRVLKSGYLETITVYSDSLKKAVMRKVVEMEQWKQAKYLIMNEAPFPGTIRDLFHFKQFHVHCEELSVEDMREMKQILFNSPGFEKCTISLDNLIDFAAVREEFGDPIHRHTHQYQIPNSTDHFELKIFEFEIRVARKIQR